MICIELNCALYLEQAKHLTKRAEAMNKSVKIVKLGDLKKGTMLHVIATAKVKAYGFYKCYYKDEKVTITK